MNNNNFDDIDKFENDPTEGIDFDEEVCPSVGMFMDAILEDKPFGMIWSMNTMIDFLKRAGYKIIEGESTLTGKPIKIAVKMGDSVIPELEFSNIHEVFNKEIQDILLNWLLKLKNG